MGTFEIQTGDIKTPLTGPQHSAKRTNWISQGVRMYGLTFHTIRKILEEVLEKYTEWNRQLNVNVIDYEKAFDSIHRVSLWYTF